LFLHAPTTSPGPPPLLCAGKPHQDFCQWVAVFSSSCFFDISLPPLKFSSKHPKTSAMAAGVLGLPDAEIDRLLAEAEARLAGGSDKGTVVTPSTATSKAVAIAASPLPAPAGDPTGVSKPKTEKLSVRVPQLAQKKKVCIPLPSTRRFHVFPDESNSQIPMMRANVPSWVQCRHQNDFLYHSYSD